MQLGEALRLAMASPRVALLLLAIGLAGCRLDDVVDREMLVSSCRREASGTACYNGDELATDRGAGVRIRDGYCVEGRCVTPSRASEIGAAVHRQGRMRLEREAVLSVVLAALLPFGTWWFRRWRRTRKPKREAYELPPSSREAPAPTLPTPSPRRERAITLLTAVLGLAPAIVMLQRYPARALASARTPPMPVGDGFYASNECHPAAVVTNDGATFLVANVFREDAALGAVGFLAAFDLDTGVPRVLVGPNRHDDYVLPLRFVSVKNKLVTLDREGVVSVLQPGSFAPASRIAVQAAGSNIQAAPGDSSEVWVGQDKYSGYVDIQSGAVIEHPSTYWVESLECWNRHRALCASAMPDATDIAERTDANKAFPDGGGCLTSGSRGDVTVVERHDPSPPFDRVWHIEHPRMHGGPEERTILGAYFYEVEVEDGAPLLVQRALSDGGKRWSQPMSGRLALETPFLAGKWLVVPVYPIKDQYGVRYEIREPETGKLARSVP